MTDSGPYFTAKVFLSISLSPFTSGNVVNKYSDILKNKYGRETIINSVLNSPQQGLKPLINIVCSN